jgi:hypothetical protein
MKTRSSSLTGLLAYILFASLALSVPQCVNCDELYSGECFDVFGIANDSANFVNTLTSRLLVPFFNFICPRSLPSCFYQSSYIADLFTTPEQFKIIISDGTVLVRIIQDTFSEDKRRFSRYIDISLL